MATKRKRPRLGELSGRLLNSRGEEWRYNVPGLPPKTPEGEELGWVVADEPRLAFGFVERGDRIVWSSFAYLGDSDTELSARTWRTLKLGEWADAARIALVDKLAGRAVTGKSDDRKRYDQARRDAAKRALPKRPRGTAFTDEELRHFAELYAEGLDASPRSPLKYVQDALAAENPRDRASYRHRSSAQRRVDAARRAGLLDGIKRNRREG